MRNGCLSALIALAAPLYLHAQWSNHTDPNTPRTRDGKPNLSAPPPRVHGKPDLSGIWIPESTPRKVLASLFPPGVGLLPGGENGLGEDDPQKYFLNILADFKPGEAPLTPAAAALLRQRLESGKKPTTLCPPASVPMSDLVPEPFKIVQNPGLTLILYEQDSVFRQIYTDGRKYPADPDPSWLGYSVGRWEGDWFVVDVMGFNDRSPLDAMGHFHSDAMKVTERFHRRDFGHMEFQLTIDDAKTFTSPVIVKFNYILLPDTDVSESFCAENEKDLAHMPGK
ncbi:MAG: hypothetical protein ABSG41_26875 [Bryobacteraceae bacterium]|jgi:hypothetical protein